MERPNVANLDDEKLQKLLTYILSISVKDFETKLPGIPDQQIQFDRCVSSYTPTNDRHAQMQYDLLKHLHNNWIDAYRDQFNSHLQNYNEDYSPNVLKNHIARFAAGTSMELYEDQNLFDRYLQIGLAVIEQSFVRKINDFAESNQIKPEDIDDDLALQLLDSTTQEWVTDSIYKIQLACGLKTIDIVLNETRVKEDYNTNKFSYDYLDHIRKENHTRTQHPTTESLEQHLEDQDDDPNLSINGGFDDVITKEYLKPALASLTPIQRQVIYAHYFEQISLVEIARRMKKDPSTISREKSLALKKLMNALKQQSNDQD